MIIIFCPVEALLSVFVNAYCSSVLPLGVFDGEITAVCNENVRVNAYATALYWLCCLCPTWRCNLLQYGYMYVFCGHTNELLYNDNNKFILTGNINDRLLTTQIKLALLTFSFIRTSNFVSMVKHVTRGFPLEIPVHNRMAFFTAVCRYTQYI